MDDLSSEEFLAMELQERLRSHGCDINFETASQQVQKFLDAEVQASGLTTAAFLSAQNTNELTSQWVDRILNVASQVGAEITARYPLIALPLPDAGHLISMLSNTAQVLNGTPNAEEIVDAALQINMALGKQIANINTHADLCLLTQIETFALSVAVRSLMELPPDVTSEPHMSWVVSCAELLDSCFTQIEKQESMGIDISEPEKRTFVVSLVETTTPPADSLKDSSKGSSFNGLPAHYEDISDYFEGLEPPEFPTSEN